jgi:predicted Zn-dependent protease
MSQQQLGQIGLVAAMIVQPGLAQFGQLASEGLGVLFLKFGRGAESQADELGFRYMTQAGYDPHEMDRDVHDARAIERWRRPRRARAGMVVYTPGPR